MSDRLSLRNVDTGQPPTPAEWRALQLRAREIMRNPYSAPELIAWAMDVLPDAEFYFWSPCNKTAAERVR